MDSEKKQYHSRERINDSVSTSKSGRNDNWIFFTAVFISILFWVLIKLSDPYTVPYTLRINYTNIPKEKRLIYISDSFVNVDVTARGFEILELNLFEDMDVLDINMDNFSLMRKEGEEYYIYSEELREKLAEIVGIQKVNVHFSKNTLAFTLADLEEKEVFVTNLIHFEFTEQYGLYEKSIFTPEKVRVFGPANILDTLQQVYTVNKEITNINSDQEIYVKLQNPAPGLLNFDPEEVSFKLRVEKFTASSIEIPIDISGHKQSIKLFPKTVKVHFKLAQKDYNNIRASQFEVVPDLQNINIENAVRLQLKLSKKPAFVRNTTLDPAYVEFLIIK